MADGQRVEATAEGEPSLCGGVNGSHSPTRPSTLEVSVLGAERVVLDGHEIPPSAWRSRQTRCLLFYALDRPPARLDEIGAVLWPDLPARKVSRMFHVTKNRLNKALGWCGFYRYDSLTQKYIFESDNVAILYDASQFEQTIRLARRQPPSAEALAAWKSALALYQGEYLSGTYDDWAITRRENLAFKQLNALLETARLSAVWGSVDEAVELYHKALENDEFCEEAYLGLIELLLKCDRFTEARHWAHRCQSQIGDLLPRTKQLLVAHRLAG